MKNITRAVGSGANPSACFAWGYQYPSLPRGKKWDGVGLTWIYALILIFIVLWLILSKTLKNTLSSTFIFIEMDFHSPVSQVQQSQCKYQAEVKCAQVEFSSDKFFPQIIVFLWHPSLLMVTQPKHPFYRLSSSTISKSNVLLQFLFKDF